jgi:hypothetical protein
MNSKILFTYADRYKKDETSDSKYIYKILRATPDCMLYLSKHTLLIEANKPRLGKFNLSHDGARLIKSSRITNYRFNQFAFDDHAK